MLQRLWSRTGCLTTVFSLVAALSSLIAQPLPQYSTRQRTQLETLRQTFEQRQTENYRQAIQLATRLGRPIDPINFGKGRVSVLHGVDDAGNLLYGTTSSVTQAGISTRTSSLYAGGSLGVNLSGSSATVKDRLGYWEVGVPRATHIELNGRITQVDNAANTRGNDAEEHATHVAGILIGAGRNPQVRGMAFGANLKSYTSSNDLSEMTSAAATMLVSNHSWGYIAGFQDDGSSNKVHWSWYGDTTISQTDDYKFGLYDSNSQRYDRILYNAPFYLPVWSASNDHYGSPIAGTSYYLVNNGNAVSTQPRNDQIHFDQIVAGAQTAKNTLTVAAAGILKTVYTRPEDVKLTYFSSWGPTDDGRIKPDITGIGLQILSASNTSDSSYVYESGTSHSSPNVAGSLLLLQEYYAQLNAGKFMRAATLKGLAIHTAEETGSSLGPDYRFGWGLLNAERAARIINKSDLTSLLDERTLNQGETYTLPVVASGKGPLRLTICWNDPEGTPTVVSKANVNDRTPKLVNDLDMRLANGSQTNLPWTLNPDQPNQAAAPGDNIRDNVEQIYIANPVPGRTYTLTISHKGTLSGTKQDYSLLISGAGGAAYCASAASTSADTKISQVQVGALNKVGVDGCTTATDNLTAVVDVQAGQTLPLSVTTGTCGTARNSILKAFVDWNQDGDFDDAGETIATSGVLANGTVFTTTTVAPTSLIDGQFARLRLVLSATEDPTTVTSCGAYAVGETQEFLLRFVRPLNDVGVVELVSPSSSFCGPTTTGGLNIGVRIRNYGSAAQQNIPVTVQVTDAANTPITSLTGVIASLGAYSETILSLRAPATVQLVPGQTYKFTVSTLLANDLSPTNNQLVSTRTTLGSSPATGLFSAARCGADSAVSLNNAGAGVAYWYDSPTGGTLLASGNRTSASSRPTYYAALNDFAGRLGPASKQDFGGGSYGGGFAPEPLLSVKVPLVIESARLYIGTPGRIRFSVKRLDETVVSSVDLDVTTTRTLPLSATATGGQLTDDPNDPGAEYPLNLQIPAAGEYKITLDYSLTPGYYTLNTAGDTLRNGDGVTIFRSNTAVSGFPFSIPGVISTRGSLFANPTTGKTDTLTAAWYYFYNIQIRSLGCPAAQRTAVTPTVGTSPTATITASGSTSICQGSSVTLSANTGAGLSYQWYRDGQPIAGATGNTIQAATTGNYVVQVANTCLPVRSSVVAVSVNTARPPLITANGFTLTTNATSNVQWLVDGVPIPGATTPTYTVVKSGRYSVKGSVNGCGEAISDDVFLTILATEPTDDGDLSVYPNPATRQVTVSMAATSALPKPPAVRLTDVRGLTVRTATMQRDGKNYLTIFDVADLPGGTFFVVVEDDRAQSVRVKRIRKQ